MLAVRRQAARALLHGGGRGLGWSRRAGWDYRESPGEGRRDWNLQEFAETTTLQFTQCSVQVRACLNSCVI